MKRRYIIRWSAVVVLIAIALLTGFTYPGQVIFFGQVAAFLFLLARSLAAGWREAQGKKEVAGE